MTPLPFPSIFSPISLSGAFAVPVSVLWAIFWLSAAIFAVMSVILFYHWETFEFDKIRIRAMTLVYFIGGAAILFVVFNAIVVYSNSL